MMAKRKTKVKNKNFVQRALENPKVWGFMVRSVLGSVFFITAFNLANTKFFNDNPIFHVRFLAEFLIGIAFGVIGFHTVPLVTMKVREWTEAFITEIVSRIVTDFWEQQTKRMQDARRQKQKEKKKQSDKKRKEKYEGTIALDTSVLVDGRIVDIVKTGFISDELVIPQGVIDELHLISDSKDELKRKKGRRGLDIINNLKKAHKIHIFKDYGDVSRSDGVDKELVRLSKKYKMKLMTMDFNLNKVAKTTGVKVLNINTLVNAVKSQVLPGEKIKVKIVQKGKEMSQGVGYLDDGTMIVVENAQNKIGKKITVTVARIIQTEAGKMVFCEN